MSKDLLLKRKELIENPTARIPICFVLDASGSMSEVVSGQYQATGETVVKDGKRWNLVSGNTVTKLSEMNAGLRDFLKELCDDELARYAAEVSIVAFAGNSTTIQDFTLVEHCDEIEIVESVNDGTSIGHAVSHALSLLDERKKQYQGAGVDYYQPWLVIMTDGEPTDDSHIAVSSKVSALVKNKKLVVFPIGVGNQVNIDVLTMFSPTRPALKLKGTKFKEFFQWLSRSVACVSQSSPGDQIKLDVDGLKGWAEL